MTLNLSASKQQTSVPISLNVNQTVNQKDSSEQNPYDNIEKSVTQSLHVEYPKIDLRNNDAMIDLVNYLVDKYSKNEKEIVTADMLIDIVREFTGADSVHLDFEDIEVNCCCGSSFKTDLYRKVAAIFVMKGDKRYNLKYNLTGEFMRLSKLKISLKIVHV